MQRPDDPARTPVPLSPPEAEADRLLAKLLAVIGASPAHDPARLCSVLASDAATADIRHLMSGVDGGRTLTFLEGVANADLPNRQDVLDLLLAAGPDDEAAWPETTLRAFHRTAVIQRTFGHSRIEALRHACRVFAEETAP